MKKLLLTTIFTITFLFAGCATIGERDTAVRLPVTYATLSVIDDSDVEAQEVYDVAVLVRDMLDDSSVAIGKLNDIVNEQIEWEKLDTPEKILVQELLNEINFQIEQHIESELLTEEERERLKVIIGYVINAAKMSGAVAPADTM